MLDACIEEYGVRLAAKRFVSVVALGVLAFGGSLALADPKPAADEVSEPIAVEARPIAAFDKADSAKTHFGKLKWRGGLVLTSPSHHFGGWSGLVVDSEGKKFFSISDVGSWMSGEIAYDGDRPVGLEGVRLGPIRAQSGEVLTRKRFSDAEGLTLVSGTLERGTVLISFERKHRIGRFDIDKDGLSPALDFIALPPGAKKMKSNKGLEAVAILRAGPDKGSLVAFAENLPDAAGDHTGWLWVKGKPVEIHLTNPGDYDVTDAAGLPDGGLLVLERRYRWIEGVKSRLRLVRRDELKPDTRIGGEMLFDAASATNHEVDNMEGLAVHAGAGGQIIVTMISDDNFNHLLQRTLLLQFAIEGSDLARAEPEHRTGGQPIEKK
jgi:hypothetical protein